MKYLRRVVWYIATRLLLFVLVVSLMVTTFYYAMNITNIYIVLKDGMAMRAQTVMHIQDGTQLKKYFQSSFLQNDPILLSTAQGTNPYMDYNVVGIDHRLNLEFAWIWPWDETVRVDISESIPRIDGRAKSSKAQALIAANGAGALYPPAWNGARYRVSLIKENGQWLIRSLTKTGNLE